MQNQDKYFKISEDTLFLTFSRGVLEMFSAKFNCCSVVTFSKENWLRFLYAFFFLNFCCIKYLGQSFYIELKKFKESRKVFKSICKKISVKMIFIKIVFLLVSRALKTGISKSFQILAYTFVFIFALILFNFIIQLPTISLVERFYIYLLNKNIQTTYGKYFL